MINRKPRVLLINPPSPEGTTVNREGVGGLGVVYPSPGAFLYPSQTLASTAAVLRWLGYSTMVLDMAAWQATPLLPARLVKTGRWDSVIISVSHVMADYDLRFSQFLRQVAGCPPITLIGPATSSLRPDLGGIPADTVVIGEPESVLLESHERILLRSGESAPALVRSAGSGFLDDLDSLPFPAWDLVPPGKGGFLTIFGSKGCDRRCAYCPYVIAQGSRVRTRSVDSIVDEMEWLSRTFSTRRVMFRDIAFARDSGRIEDLCSSILRRKGLALRWECESHPFDFQPKLLALMKRAGCAEIKTGLETAQADLLYGWGRVGSMDQAGAYLDHVAGILKSAGEIGVRCHLFLMVGAPGQGQESIQTTLNYLRPLNPGLLNVKRFQTYPGISLKGRPGDPQDATVFSQLLRSCQSTATAGHTGGFLHGLVRPLRRQPATR